MKNLLKEFTPEFLEENRYKISVENVLESSDALLLDVRSCDEVECMSIEEGLVYYPELRYMHIPMNELPDRLEELLPFSKIFIFCRTTSRSAIVYAFLRLQGLKHVRLVEGGYVKLLKTLVKKHGLF